MIRLHHVFGAQTGRVQEFDGPVVRFGRLPENDVAFDAFADLDASGKHAEIHREADGYVILDIGSRNGTMVNGDRIQRRRIEDGDIVEFGRGGPRIRCEIAPEAPVLAPALAMAMAPTAAYDVVKAPLAASPVARPPSAPPVAASAAAAPVATKPARASVADIVKDVLREARSQPGRKTSTFFRELASQMSARASPLAKALMVTIVVGAIAAVAAVVVIVARDGATHRELPERYAELVARAAAPGGNAAATLQELRVVEAEIARSAQARGEQALNRVRSALWRVVAANEPVCTAFAVRSDLLATSAACVRALTESSRAGQSVKLVRADASRAELPIQGVFRHPPVGGAEPDVGLIRIRGTIGSTAPLATPAELTALGSGSLVFAPRFDSGAAVPYSAAGVVTRLGALAHTNDGAQALGDRGGRRGVRIEYGAVGTSRGNGRGAPLLDDGGRVVGILSDEPRAIPSTPGSPPMPQLFVAMRADLLLSLIAGLEQEPPR